MSEMDSGFKNKFDTSKMSVEDLKMCRMEEEATRPPEPPPAVENSRLHPQPQPHPRQAEGYGRRPGLRTAGRYPVVLVGMAVLSGISTLMYYRSVQVQPIQGTNPSMSLQDSAVHVSTGNEPAPAAD